MRNTVCYAGLNVKLTPTHAGITVGPDGGSHQMLEDIALMRVLPGMRVLVPADYVAAKAAIRLAAATPGPFYIRLGRAGVPVIYDEDYRFELGAARVLREGVHVTLAACGVMVEQALAAAEELELEGIHAEVLDVATIKPLPAEAIAASARKTGAVVTCEEHSIIGGLGSAVAEALGELAPVPLVRVGVRDVFGTSGEPAELMAHFGLMGSRHRNGSEGVALASEVGGRRNGTSRASPGSAPCVRGAFGRRVDLVTDGVRGRPNGRILLDYRGNRRMDMEHPYDLNAERQ